MKFKNIKDPEMGVDNKSDSQHKDDSVDITSAASTSGSNTNDNQSNKMLAEEITSISKKEVVAKKEDSKVIPTPVLVLQNTASKSDDCMVTSTSESSSSESQEYKVPSEPSLYNTFSLAAAELEETLKAEDSDVCMTDASDIQDSDNAATLTSQLNTNKSRCIKIPSEKNLSATEVSKSSFNIEESKSHRQKNHYSSESSDYETDESSDSSDCEEFFDNMRKSVAPEKLPVLKTKGELRPEDLPPVEDLHITVHSTELLKIGKILHCVVAEERNEFLVIVESDANSNPLDEDSVLFLSSDKPLGKIHDVFGNVSKPKYVVRFNKAEDISNKGVTTGQFVYYSPANGELTRYVLVDVLKKQKGSDASWKDNNEPPDDEIDYSDDEQEKLAKQKRRAKTRGKERNWNDGEVEDVTPNKMDRGDATYSQKRAFKRPSRNMFQSSSPGPSSSSTRSYSPQSFGSAPSPFDNFGSSGPLRNTISPQSFGFTSSNSSPFQQRNVPSPQPFRPFPHSNVPSPQPFRPFPHSNVPSPQPFRPFSHSNVPSPQSFGQLPHSNVPPPQPLGPISHSNVPSPQSFRPFPHSNMPSHQSFGSFQQSSVSSYQPCTTPPTYVLTSPNPASSHATCAPQLNPSSLMAAPQNNVYSSQSLVTTPSPYDNFGSSGLLRNAISPQSFGFTSSNSSPFQQRNVPSPQPFRPFPHSNVPSPHSFGQLPHSNVPPPQPLGPISHSNAPSPQPFRPFPHSNMQSHQTFGSFPQSSVSSYQHCTAPPTYVLTSPNLASSRATCAPQLSPSSLMAAPQNNVPLQQQLLLQLQQPITTFLSRPPPNFN